jgi:DNA (cytosine-5)-methyltransferase 1
MESIKVLSLFSGIGAFEKALFNLNIKYQLINYCEIDKFASYAYSAIHNVSEDLNLKDITKINIESLPYCDLITHGSPCQDFSIAGTNKGGDEGSNTRSSLMWNTVNIVEYIRPRYVIWENVKNVLSKKHKHNFDKYIEILKKLGYNSYYKVLNAKDFNIPQNRERVFVVSIRKDTDKGFTFPEGTGKKKVSEFLQCSVSDKYYYSNRNIESLIRKKEQIFTIKNGDGYKDFIPSKETIIDISYLTSNSRRGRVKEGYTPTILTECSIVTFDLSDFRLRKLTPLECWRLMGFDDTDYHKARKNLEKTFYNGKDRSDSQMYKMAGNSIVVDVLESIFKVLLLDQD